MDNKLSSIKIKHESQKALATSKIKNYSFLILDQSFLPESVTLIKVSFPDLKDGRSKAKQSTGSPRK